MRWRSDVGTGTGTAAAGGGVAELRVAAAVAAGEPGRQQGSQAGQRGEPSGAGGRGAAQEGRPGTAVRLASRAPLDARDVAVKGAAHVLKVGEDKGAAGVKAAGNDVLGILTRQPPRLLHRQAAAGRGGAARRGAGRGRTAARRRRWAGQTRGSSSQGWRRRSGRAVAAGQGGAGFMGRPCQLSGCLP